MRVGLLANTNPIMSYNELWILKNKLLILEIQGYLSILTNDLLIFVNSFFNMQKNI